MNSKTYRASALATTLLAAVTSASALQTIGDSLEVTQQLTIRGDALFEGVTAFGKLPSQSTAGYLTDVYQGVSTVEREEIIPAHEEYQTVYVDDYGWMFQVVWVDDYGWVYRDVWNPEQYDSEGNILSFGYWTNHSGRLWEDITIMSKSGASSAAIPSRSRSGCPSNGTLTPTRCMASLSCARPDSGTM